MELEYTTTSGIKVRVRAVNPYTLQKIEPALRTEWAKQGKALPTVPTYEAQTVGGGKETHEHNPTTLTTEEERADWAEYVRLQNALIREVIRRQLVVIIATCVIFEMPTDDRWIKRQALLHIDVPADEDERRLHYIETEIVGSQADIDAIYDLAQLASGVTQSAQNAAEASFPPGVERPPTGGVATDAGQVDGQPVL